MYGIFHIFRLGSNLSKLYESILVSNLFVLIRNVMSVVITEIYGNKEKIAEHSKNGSLAVWGQKSTVLKRILACIKIFTGM